MEFLIWPMSNPTSKVDYVCVSMIDTQNKIIRPLDTIRMVPLIGTWVTEETIKKFIKQGYKIIKDEL